MSTNDHAPADQLRHRLQQKEATIGVVGLGYVGLPLAVEYADRGFSTIGIDLDETRVRRLNDGVNYNGDLDDEHIRRLVAEGHLQATTSYDEAQDIDVFFVCVPTPVTEHKDPDTSYVEAATASISEHLRPGQLVILKSTTYPTTTETVIQPILEEAAETKGLTTGEDVFLAFSPERIDPGNETYTLENTPVVVGGVTPTATDLAEQVTAHGMLDPWALKHSRWKKRIAGWLYENRNLREADCVQVNSEAERRAVRDYGIDAPVCIIPNGVSLPNDEPGLDPPWKEQIPEDRHVLLFLGRIHPKKGLSELLNAWEQFSQEGSREASEWSLAIVGWDDGGHEARLKRMAEEAGLDDVHFLGPMFGDDKEAAFHHADAFILPSHSEGLPMAVLEAWSYRLPVLMTPACNLPIGFDKRAAVQVEPAPTSIADGIHTLCAQSEADRREMGRRGRTLVEERFTWAQVAQQMANVYRWVLGEGAPPSTVVFD